MRRLTLFAMLLVAVFMGVAGQLHAQGSYKIRGVHLLSETAAVDFYLGNRTPATIQNVPFEYTSALSGNLPVEAPLNIKVAPAGAGIAAAVIDRDVTVAGNTDYTAIAYGSTGAPKFKFLSRPRSQVPSGADKSLLRVFNGMSASTAFDIYLDSTNGDPLFAGVTPDSATAFKQINADPATVILTASGSKTPVAELVAPLPPNTYLTLILTGSSTAELKAYLLDGRDPDGVTTPRELTVLQGREGLLPTLRALHAVPQSPIHKLDVYQDNGTTPRTSNLIYRSATEIYSAVAGPSAIRFVQAGQPPSEAVLTAPLTLRQDSGYVVVATQFRDGSITPMIMTRYLPTPPPDAGNARIRVANATDFFGDPSNPSANLSIVIKPQGSAEIRFDNVAFQATTEWMTVPQGVVDVEVYRPGTTDPIFTGSQKLTEAGFFTFVMLGNTERFTVDILNESNNGAQIPMRSFGTQQTSVPLLAMRPELAPITAAPNPFSTSSRIGFRLDGSGEVAIELVDMLGRTVTRQDAGWHPAGSATVELAGHDLAPGAYTCIVTVDGSVHATGRVLVITN